MKNKKTKERTKEKMNSKKSQICAIGRKGRTGIFKKKLLHERDAGRVGH